MKYIKKLLLSVLFALGITSFSVTANAACGKIVMADMNWASANLMANVPNFVDKVFISLDPCLRELYIPPHGCKGSECKS